MRNCNFNAIMLLSVALLGLVSLVSEVLSDDNFYRIPESTREDSSVFRKFIKRQTQFLDESNDEGMVRRNEPNNLNLQNVNYVDNRKPHFHDCKSYNPSVKEEQSAGAFVIRVKALDPDNDNLEYSLITAPGERHKFKINGNTGEITTAHIFDRDEPIREKEAYITVRVTDNGKPQLYDACTFKLTIEDINDNAPVFDKAKYDENMPEDTTVNKVVTRISASDLDDGDNSIIKYEILPERDFTFFKIDENSGVIILARPIDKRRSGSTFYINVRAYNTIADPIQDAQIEVRIRVIESNKKPPVFIDPPSAPIYLKENFNDFSKSLLTLTALSNVQDNAELIFELVTGRTEQTNSKKTFVFNQQTDNSASISLGKTLDYEAITDYTLTVTVKNSYDLLAEHFIHIKVEDVNDNIPYFTEVTTGTVSENEPAGTQVMQVRAFDMDGLSANNIVTFELADNQELFKIDRITGNITTLVQFDREERDFYNVKIIATDNSPSSLYNTGKHNSGQQVFRIEITDKNDHKPKFQKDEYSVFKLAEDANINQLVIEVTAIDKDTASQITYSIEDGNIGNAFKIENTTGKISVNGVLDYENITDYSLTIRAFDGAFEDFAKVNIKIDDVNDNPPRFYEKEYKTTIFEEKLVEGCILNIQAWDPDIKDPNSPQFIKYSIVTKEHQELMDIDEMGCLKLKRPLDRDKPNGRKEWQILVKATDQNAQTGGIASVADVTITLTDINDNAPFLTNHMPVIYYENQSPKKITHLEASDYDEAATNGGPIPFNFLIDPMASIDIRSKFEVINDYLTALVEFDREQQKEYFIPITVSDNGYPAQSNVSILHLVIGDENDNEMRDGESSIFVYNFKGEAPDTEIGRVYVDDPDDWDLGDKTFTWHDGMKQQHFDLNSDNGMITMLDSTPEGEYELKFSVTEESKIVSRHYVNAVVRVTIKVIPQEAVDKSGSIRFYGITAEEFVSENPVGNPSPKERFRNAIAEMFNVSRDGVDVFTVLKNDADSNLLDVRFSAHGSPYKEAEHLDGKVALNQAKLEKELNLQMLMIHIDECLIEKAKCDSGCHNFLHSSPAPLTVFTNQTSFVGVSAIVIAKCECESLPKVNCLNGGTAVHEVCECLEGYEGPHCEVLAIGFYGSGYALYKPLQPCDTQKISLELLPSREDGLVMYAGPIAYNSRLPVQDFMALELVGGYPVLTVDYGTGSIRIEHKYIKMDAGRSYTVDILLQRASVEMTVDNCKLSTCMSLGAPQGKNEFLNVNSPLQIGGSAVDLDKLGRQFNWTHIPQNQGYSGCIRNLTVDDKTYNIGQPSFFKNADQGCQRSVAVAVSLGIDRNFLIAILVCIVVLLILILAVVVHKRSYDGWHEKDMDDIRETIINYEDEGGGERDTDYDLNVLRGPPIYEDKPYKDMRQKEAHEVPDIGAFLVDKKDACDRDMEAYPIDDVRHYAYEGDGNSTGSLSSLASCTDEGDLKFNYLSNFGPRFRKLADMYGEEPSDEDSNGDADEGWRI